MCHVEASGETFSGFMQTEDVFRHANDRIAEMAAELEWRDPLPFLCECSDERCFAQLQITLEQYDCLRAHPQRYLIKPGHQLSGGVILEQTDRVTVAEKLYAGHES